MPSSCNYPLQESLVQHFLTTHVNDLEERVNQLMAARRANNWSLHTHTPPKTCSYCYNTYNQIDGFQFINHYMIDKDDASKSSQEYVQTTTILRSEKKVVNKVEEKDKQIEPPPIPNLSNDKEVSAEAPSFITIPFETHHKAQASFPQFLKEPSYAKFSRIYAL